MNYRYKFPYSNNDIEQENKNLKNKAAEYENNLAKIQKDNENLKTELQKKINVINQIKNERDKEIKAKTNLELKLKESNQYEEKDKNFIKKIKELEQIIQKLKADKENNQKDSEFNLIEKEKLSKDPLEFYDVIGNINSMKNISINGWDFYMNEEGAKISQLKELPERLVIGVMGERNKGKSFILQALSGASLKTGTTINTIGISIKYLDDKYVLLDCAGSESPILGEKVNILEISRDKLFTEAFLETYILRKSNVLLLVIGILSFSEQKLINKIIKDLDKLKENEKKNLVIIHNLQTYEKISEVEKYIDETLLKSASFKIKKDKTNFGEENESTEFFYDLDNTSVKHFIYARENSEAGNKYNIRTINAIKSLYRISTDKYKYDFKETIMEHFKFMSEKMYDGNMQYELIEVKENDDKKTNYEKNKNEIIDENNEEKNMNNIESDLINSKYVNICKLKYSGNEKLSLQKMVIDELGVCSFITNDFIPDFEMYYNDSELIINIECPEGTVVSAKRKRNKDENQNYPFAIEIKEEREEEPKKENVTYIKNKKSGKFYALIPFKNHNFSIAKGEECEKSKDGWKSFRFPLSKVEDDSD